MSTPSSPGGDGGNGIVVIDVYLLALTAIVTFAMQMAFFVVAAGCKFDKVTDFAYGTNFVLLALLCLLLPGYYAARGVVVAVMVMVWGVRLAGYLLMRILIIGADKRFDHIRDSLWRFFVFWLLQFFIVFTTFLPVTLLLRCTAASCNPPHRWHDYVGYAMFVVGLVVETVADQQKFAYRRNEANRGHWCDVGLWSWSRHPNYFGELLLWWGLFVVCAAAYDEAWMFVGVLGPLLLTVSILFISGITRLEASADERYATRDDYLAYKAQTSVLLLVPPALFRRLPAVATLLCCCEWSLYNPYRRNAQTVALDVPRLPAAPRGAGHQRRRHSRSNDAGGQPRRAGRASHY